MFGCGGGLLVGFSKSATEDTRAGYNDLGNDAVGLVGESEVSMAISEHREKGDGICVRGGLSGVNVPF